MEIEVSNGEIIDKLTILTIKKENIRDEKKLINIKKELEYLTEKSIIIGCSSDLYFKLYKINKKLWDIEDQLREKEQNNEFNNRFTELARLVYITNDERAEIKKQINNITGSLFVEEKSYNKYSTPSLSGYTGNITTIYGDGWSEPYGYSGTSYIGIVNTGYKSTSGRCGSY